MEADPSAVKQPPSPSGRALQAQPTSISKAAQHRRARRAQLRDFYGIKPGAAAQGTDLGAEVGGDATTSTADKQAKNFNAAAYYDELVGRASLVDLMQQASKLSSDVGNLHSARHSLVYNHHHQLFAAGDAIQVLNQHTPHLIAIMTSLQDSFSSISQLVDAAALPETPAIPDGGVHVNITDRLSLLLEAKEESERLDDFHARFRDELEAAAAAGSKEARLFLNRFASGADPITVE